MRSEPIVVLGAGGHAQVVVATLRECGLAVAGMFDDDSKKWGQSVLGVPVLGGLDEIPNSSEVWGVCGVGSNRTRQQLAQRFLHLRWKTVVHPSAYVHESVTIGPGTVIMARAVLQPSTRIGAHVIVNTAAIVDHNCRIDDFAHAAPGANLAGNVRVGEGTLLGIGGTVAPGISMGPWSTVGAGAVVVRDLAPHVTAMGIPARAAADGSELQRDAA